MKCPAFFLGRRKQTWYLFGTICETRLSSPPNDALIYSPFELRKGGQGDVSGEMFQSVKCLSPKDDGPELMEEAEQRTLVTSVLVMQSGDPRSLLASQSNQPPSSKFSKSPPSKSKVKSNWGSYQCWLCTLPLVCKHRRKHTCTHSCMHAQSRNTILESSMKNIYTYSVMNRNQLGFWLAKIYIKTFINLYLSSRIQMIRPFFPGLNIHLFETIIVYM